MKAKVFQLSELHLPLEDLILGNANVLEMQMNDYIEYICNNMLISNQMTK